MLTNIVFAKFYLYDIIRKNEGEKSYGRKNNKNDYLLCIRSI